MNINKLDLFTKKINTKKPTAPKKIRLRIFPLGILLFEIFGIDFITILYRKIDNGLIFYGQDEVFTGRPVST